MSKEFIGDHLHVNCIDRPPTLEHHQQRQDQCKTDQLERLTAQASIRNANNAVETLQHYAAELEPFGTRTKPPSWFRRKYIRWSYKLQEIIKIIRE